MAKNNNLTDFLTDVADAIRAKEGSTAAINPQAFSPRILALQTGGGGGAVVSAKDVNFRDYDGTILHSYSKNAFLALTELPPLPSQDGLICQEWNWSLEEAKAYVEEYGVLEVGATYITDDGKTRLYIDITNELAMSLGLRLKLSNVNGVTIDWGDGTTESNTSSGEVTISHAYADLGKYLITLQVNSGTIQLGHSNSSQLFNSSLSANALYKAEIGSTVKDLSTAFRYCYSLALISIPRAITSISSLYSYAFALKSIVVPRNCTSVNLQDCSSLKHILLPSSLSSISTKVFMNCGGVEKITITKGVTSIPYCCFQNAYSLTTVTIPNTITTVSAYAFQYCKALRTISIPDSVTAFPEYLFSNCSALIEARLPNKLKSVGTYAFQKCVNITSFSFPGTLTTISANAFNGCSAARVFDFRAHTSVPTLSATSAFSNVHSSAKIIVPDELYDSWIAATNWSNSSIVSKIVKASEYNG